MSVIEIEPTLIDDWSKRLWDRIDVRGPDDCWPFLGGIGEGYGRLGFTITMYVDGVPRRTPTGAHRAAWFSLRGPIEQELTIDHQCHNRDLSCKGGPSCLHRRCCNPAHLEPVPAKVNISRGRSGEFFRSKTHCPKGHEYAVYGKVYVSRYTGHPSRVCKLCERDWPSRRKQVR